MKKRSELFLAVQENFENALVNGNDEILDWTAEQLADDMNDCTDISVLGNRKEVIAAIKEYFLSPECLETISK